MTTEVTFGELKNHPDMLPPPAYTISPIKKFKAAKIFGVTAVIISIIIAAAVLIGLFFTRNQRRQEQINFVIMSDSINYAVKADINYNDKVEKLSISNGDLITLKDYNKALAAFVNKTDYENCFIRELTKEDMESFKNKKFFRNNEVYSPETKEISYTKLPDQVHPEVVRFAAGNPIADFCLHKSVYWLISKDETNKMKRQAAIPALSFNNQRDGVVCLYANGYDKFQTPQVFYQCNIYKNII